MNRKTPDNVLRVENPTITTFCKELLKEYKTPQLVWPETIAEKFSDYFGLLPPIGKEEIIILCEEMGLHSPVETNLPQGIRGVHIGVNNEFAIGYQKGEWEGGIKHTILHEIWEIINHILNEYVPCEIIPNSKLESRANKFAAAVLMPRKQFLSDCVIYSFNPLILRERYGQSYHSILIRMRDVLGWKTTFIGLMYENTALNKYFKQYRNYNDICNNRLEVNQIHNFILMCNAFTYHFKSMSGFLNILPPLGDGVEYRTFFCEMITLVVEQEDIVRFYNMPQMKNMVFSCYPVFNKFELLEKIIIAGINACDWETPQKMLENGSGKGGLEKLREILTAYS